MTNIKYIPVCDRAQFAPNLKAPKRVLKDPKTVVKILRLDWSNNRSASE